MNSDDMMKLFHMPLEPRKEAVEEAARTITKRDEDALIKAAEKRLRKQMVAIDAARSAQKGK
jgi:hypothetical protein